MANAETAYKGDTSLLLVTNDPKILGKVTTGYATCGNRYILVRNTFATHYIQYKITPLSHKEKKTFIFLVLCKPASPKVKVLDFAKRQRA